MPENEQENPASTSFESARPGYLAWLGNRKYSAFLVALIVAAFVSLLRPSIRGHDGVMNSAYLRSMLVDGDLDFTNEYTHYLDLYAEWFDHKREDQLKRHPVTNLPINLYGVGSSLMWSPFYAAAHAMCKFGPLSSYPADGYSRPYEWAIGIGSCFYASTGLWLLYVTLRRLAGRANGFWAVVAAWLATPVVCYAYLHPSMTHANGFFLAALLLVVYATSDRVIAWAAMGAIAGLLALNRFQDATLALGIAGGELWRLWMSGWKAARLHVRERIARYAVAAVAGAFAFTPQFAAWSILQGSPFSGPQAYLDQGSVTPLMPVHAFDVLFSGRHGLFYWHPVLMAAFAGLLVRSRHRAMQMVGLVGFAAELWIISSWSIWWGGASFGHRMFISALPFLAVGLALLLRVMHTRKRVAAQVGIVGLILWNFGYIVQYGTGMVSRQEAVPLSALIRNNLITIPSLAIEHFSK
jgi:hypothetical protein